MKYTYTCKDSAGELQSGTIEAPNEIKAANMLHTQGLFVLELKTGSIPFQKIASNLNISSSLFKKVTLKDKIIFTQQLAMMIKAGLPLIDAFAALVEQTENKYFASVIADIALGVKGGKTISEIIAQYPRIFSKFYIAVIHSGEKSGKLDEVLARLAEQLQKDYDLITKIKAAITYPILVIVTLVGIVILMLIFVIPQLKTIFRDMGVELPLVTRIILGTSDLIINYWYIIILLLLGLALGWRFWMRTAAGKLIWDRFKLKIPLIGPIIRKIYMTRFCRTTGTLVASGLPILNIIDTIGDVIDNRVYQNAFKKISKDIENGIQFSVTLKKQMIFPAMIYHLIAIGEKSGKLDYVLLSMADFFDKEVEATTSNLATLIEPILIIIIGAGVGLVVASVIMPIYSLVNVI